MGPLSTDKLRLSCYYLVLVTILAAVAALIDGANGYLAAAATEAAAALFAPLVFFLSRRASRQHLAPRYGLWVTFAIMVIGSVSQLDRADNLIWLPVFPLVFFFLSDSAIGLRFCLAGLAVLGGFYVAHPYLNATAPVAVDTLLQLVAAYVLSATLAYHYERVQRQQRDELRKLADHDQLTEVLNRRGFFSLVRSHSREQRRPESHYAVVLLDLDDFKEINDRCGHDVGDEVLRRVAHTLRQRARTADIVARWGGEEFSCSCRTPASRARSRWRRKSASPSATSASTAARRLRAAWAWPSAAAARISARPSAAPTPRSMRRRATTRTGWNYRSSRTSREASRRRAGRRPVGKKPTIHSSVRT